MKIKIEEVMPVIMGIFIITIVALATSCSTTSKVSMSKYGMHVNKTYNICPAYN
tara:strand:+ start:2561 stop:2722 length:162 start_codon:yes stop_codon:yes gene_type:complete